MLERTLQTSIERARGPHLGVRFIDRSERVTFFSYEEIFQRAARIAGGLEQLGIRQGDRVAIVLPTSMDFLDAFYGTTLAGDVDSIQTLDQNYLKVQETGMFEIETTYTSIDEVHEKVYLTYRYFGDGSANHKVEMEIWNYDTSAWDDIIITDGDLPATNIDSTLIFDIPGTLADYYTGSLPNLSAKLRIRHASNNNTDHQFWLDTIGFGELETIYTAPDNASIEVIREWTETYRL